MLRTNILVVAVLVVAVGASPAATPWVEASLGFTTYDLSDVNRDLTDGETLHGMLHTDAGTKGTYESGMDTPIKDGLGDVRVEAFDVTVN